MFYQEVRSGQAGVRIHANPQWELLSEHPRSCQLLDREAATYWRFSAIPFRLSLLPQEEARLRQDAELAVRHDFVQAHYAILEERAGEESDPFFDRPPRTHDPSWSPIIEHGVIELQGHRVLRMIHRLCYLPGREIIQGRLLIPVEQGTFELEVTVAAGSTGYREAMLMVIASQGGAADEMQFPPQSYYDDPANDASFPDHPLSIVREQLQRAVESMVEILAYDHSASPEPALLEGAQCVVKVPPRYVRVPEDQLRMSPGLTMFTRIVYTTGANAASCEVYLLRGAQLEAGNVEGLRAIATQITMGWENEGVSSIELSFGAPIETEQGVELDLRVDFALGDSTCLAFQRWILLNDGRVYRLALNTEPWMSPELALEELRELRRGWRPLKA